MISINNNYRIIYDEISGSIRYYFRRRIMYITLIRLNYLPQMF